jgi:tetratricopeptide (TPR) repeat protein
MKAHTDSNVHALSAELLPVAAIFRPGFAGTSRAGGCVQALRVIMIFVAVMVVTTAAAPAVPAAAQQAVTKDNPERVRLLKVALDHFNDKQYDSAVTEFRKAYALDTTRIEVRYEMALAFAAKRTFDSAESILREILPHPKAIDKYYQLLSNLRAEQDDTSGARMVIDDGIKRFPQSGRLHMERGMLYIQARRLDEAADEFEEGIQVDPGYHMNYYWAARSYSQGSERIWTLLYGEVLMNVDPNPSRLSIISDLIYRMHMRTYEDFRTSNAMNYSLARKGSADASAPVEVSFEDRFDELMTIGAAKLRFFQDFEIPLLSIDTMQTVFIKEWYKRGYDALYPNAAIERHKTLLDAGLHSSYVVYLMQFAKPLEAKAYFDANKKNYQRLLAWMKEHPFEMSTKNRFSRYMY